jgi:hypothetical protein
VGGVLATDVIATTGLAARVVTHYAGYYGYDTREEEKAVLLAVIGLVSLERERPSRRQCSTSTRWR